MIKIFKKEREVSIFSIQKKFKDQKSDFSGVVILQAVCPQNVSSFLHLNCFLSLDMGWGSEPQNNWVHVCKSFSLKVFFLSFFSLKVFKGTRTERNIANHSLP